MLKILNNKTENTHENEQFRRIVKIIQCVFEKYNFEGILIGNPFNDLFFKFQADALLYYNNGLIIFDFKDYEGIIEFPDVEDDFQSGEWYIERFNDRSKVRIKGGSYVNPFKQLKKYREEFYDIVANYPQLNLDPSKIGSINVFSGPIEVKNQVPKKFRFYRLLQESNLEDCHVPK
ncbi:NERD domain-containing protein [Chryseobacterium sp. TY4]